jgi:hypothetical protein
MGLREMDCEDVNWLELAQNKESYGCGLLDDQMTGSIPGGGCKFF